MGRGLKVLVLNFIGIVCRLENENIFCRVLCIRGLFYLGRVR